MGMTIDDLGAMIGKDSVRTRRHFDHINKRFDSLEKRMMHIEALGEEHSGKFIAIEDRLSKIEYTLDEANPQKLKKRTEKLEKKVFGSIQTA